ncbi:MAG TPA: hypothetical protein VER98_14105, partial [Terriglobia bacterium]|nr:hypothetical protein [Terriglobia bacterium]
PFRARAAGIRGRRSPKIVSSRPRVVYSFLNLNEGITSRLRGFQQWASRHNPFFVGLIPLLILTIVLYLVGRETLLKPKPYLQGNR